MICLLSLILRLRAIATKQTLVSLLLSLVTAYTHAQAVETEKKSVTQRQYIILTTGDTLDVEIIPPSRAVPYGDSVWLQNHIIIKEKNKQRELPLQEIMSYEYKGIVRETISLVKDSKVIPFVIEYKCCKRIVYGPISLFECYNVVPGFRDPSVNVVTTEMFYKRGNTFSPGMFLSFNKGMAKAIKDYPELSVRVRNGEFERKDMAKVIIEYNTWVNQNKK